MLGLPPAEPGEPPALEVIDEPGAALQARETDPSRDGAHVLRHRDTLGTLVEQGSLEDGRRRERCGQAPDDGSVARCSLERQHAAVVIEVGPDDASAPR